MKFYAYFALYYILLTPIHRRNTTKFSLTHSLVCPEIFIYSFIRLFQIIHVSKISRLVSDLQTPNRGGSLVVETGFLTSLVDIFVKNRDRLRDEKNKKKSATAMARQQPSPATVKLNPRSCLYSGPIETKLGQRSSSFNGKIESNSNKKFMGKLKGGNSSKLSADLVRVYGSIYGSLRYDDVDDVEHHYYDDGDEHDHEFDNEFLTKSLNLQWAQGKVGEDRVHIMILEKTGWVFVGIYDGFNGPDAPDFLLHNLYSAMRKEFNGLLWDYGKLESNFDDHGGVLAGLAEALKKTEEAYLEMAMENPELAMMGFCVLEMLMKGDDI